MLQSNQEKRSWNKKEKGQIIKKKEEEEGRKKRKRLAHGDKCWEEMMWRGRHVS